MMWGYMGSCCGATREIEYTRTVVYGDQIGIEEVTLPVEVKEVAEALLLKREAEKLVATESDEQIEISTETESVSITDKPDRLCSDDN